MPKTQKYGIKFPITIKSGDNTMLDVNNTIVESVVSQMMHIIFTPKGQRIRRPTFGTNLIQYVFNPNDSQQWGDIVSEIKDSVCRRISGCSVSNVMLYATDDGLGVIAKITYTVTENGNKNEYETAVKL